MIKIAFDSSEIDRMVRRIIERGGNLTPALDACGEIMLTSVDKNFEAEGRFSTVGDVRGGSTRWKDLADATKLDRIGGSRAFTKRGDLRKKAKRKLSGLKILQRSGKLAASFSKRTYGNTCEVGSNRVYAAIHHFGGNAGRGRKVKIPARPILVVQDEDEENMLYTLDRYITG